MIIFNPCLPFLTFKPKRTYKASILIVKQNGAGHTELFVKYYQNNKQLPVYCKKNLTYYSRNNRDCLSCTSIKQEA